MMGGSLQPQVHFDGQFADDCKEKECTVHYCAFLHIIAHYCLLLRIVAWEEQAQVKVCQVTKEKNKIIQSI